MGGKNFAKTPPVLPQNRATKEGRGGGGGDASGGFSGGKTEDGFSLGIIVFVAFMKSEPSVDRMSHIA